MSVVYIVTGIGGSAVEKKDLLLMLEVVIYRAFCLDVWKRHPMRLKLTRVGLLVELANHYTTKGAFLMLGVMVLKKSWIVSVLPGLTICSSIELLSRGGKLYISSTAVRFLHAIPCTIRCNCLCVCLYRVMWASLYNCMLQGVAEWSLEFRT